MLADQIPMSKEGYEKLKHQLDTMNNEEMPRIAEQIAEARAFGDLSENAEYDAAREAQGMLQARINELQDKLARAMIVDRSKLPTDRVVFGSRVTVLDLDMKDEEDFILVGQGDEDYDQNKILLTSPIGKELVGKQVGDEVSVPIPRGTLRLRIVRISFELSRRGALIQPQSSFHRPQVPGGRAVRVIGIRRIGCSIVRLRACRLIPLSKGTVEP